MSNLPVTLIITLGASLFVAFVMNPVFAVTFMKKEDHNTPSKLKDYLKGFIFFGVVAAISYLTGRHGIGNLSVFFLILLLLYHFVFHRSIVGFQEVVDLNLTSFAFQQNWEEKELYWTNYVNEVLLNARNFKGRKYKQVQRIRMFGLYLVVKKYLI